MGSIILIRCIISWYHNFSEKWLCWLVINNKMRTLNMVLKKYHNVNEGMGRTEMKLTKSSQVALMGMTCYYPYEQRRSLLSGYWWKRESLLNTHMLPLDYTGLNMFTRVTLFPFLKYPTQSSSQVPWSHQERQISTCPMRAD